MAIEGPIRELALSDVLQLLELTRKTGVLTVHRDPARPPARLRFARGGITAAELPGVSEQLGHLLLRAGKVTEADIDRARRAQTNHPGRPLGALLVDLGIVETQDVQRQLRFQIQEAVFHLMRWQDGYFRFEEGPQDASEIEVRVPTESLLMEAARRIDEWATLEAKVPHVNVVPLLVEGPEGTTLDLRPAEWEVLAEIDGLRTLRTIAAELGRSEFDVARTIFGLVSTGVVEIADAAAGSRGRRERPLFAALAEAEQVLQRGDPQRALALVEPLVRSYADQPEVQLLAGRAMLASGSVHAAVDGLRRAAETDPLSPAAHFHLGFALAKAGDLDAAVTSWITYLRLPDADPDRRELITRSAAAAAGLSVALGEWEP